MHHDAAYIINWLPLEVIENKTPYEIVYGQKPDYESLKVFGCLAYYRSTETKGDKFEERGRPRIFLGYLWGTKGYKIYDVNNGKIIMSRDVRFVENTLPYDSNVDQKEDEKPEIFEFPIWYYDYQNPHENTSNINEENEPETESPNSGVDKNIHEGDVMQNDTDIGNLQQNEGLAQVAEPKAQIENVGQANVTEPTTQTETEHEEPAKEKRTRTCPARLNDYVVNLSPSIDQASTKSNLNAISLNDEPKTFKQAIQNENWREAMKKEIHALETNDTWTLEDPLEGKRAIDSN
ncbi:uncharacterized protein LOC143570145 [Bidens hawaiensis]|uniref:uncharacterized protein LOC143570145 n=1 Tax=Bidens hawaiensis TaxID=980011 RepID=UPI00404911F1